MEKTLIVDDEKQMLGILSHLLSQDYEISIADSGKAAFQELK